MNLERIGESEWLVPQHHGMRVPGRIFADRETIAQLEEDTAARAAWNAYEQVIHVASLPGIVSASIALPDVHPGYGFPIGGVGAFDIQDGVAVVGGVGFDINCGVRMLATPMQLEDLAPQVERLADDLFATVPAGLGSTGSLRLAVREIDALLRDGAKYVVDRGYGELRDLEFIEEKGRMGGADPEAVSTLAKQRQFRQVGTLGSGNHYLEVQVVDRVLDEAAARAYGLVQGQIVVSIHTGSRALGHQIGQDYLKEMAVACEKYGLQVPERELVCAPISSPEGRRYLQAVACGANCAYANRQVIAYHVRTSLERICGIAPQSIRTVYDVGHNTVKRETHRVAGEERELLVHRKGSTRAFGPGRPEAPARYVDVGHPIFVGGSMGTASYVMRGTRTGMEKTFGSGIHGAGRAMSRKKAVKRYWGEDVLSELSAAGIVIRAHSARSVAEEAPGAYKDVESVVGAAEAAGINRAVARLRPVAVVKG